MRRFRPLTLLALAVSLILAVAACGGSSNKLSGGKSSGGGSKGTLVIGSAGFTESTLLANMYATVLQKAGYKTQIKTVANRELYEPALEKGEIDIVPDYAATMADFLNTKVNGANAPSVASSNIDSTMTALNKLAGPLGLTALTPSKAVDQNAFVVAKTFASKHNLKTLSDLGQSGQSVTLAAGEECATRPFCEPGLKKTYGIKVTKIDPLGVDTAQTKKAVQSGKDQLGLALTTDGTLADFGLVALTDDKGLQNSDNLVPIVNTKKADKSDIKAALDKLGQALTTEDLATLNKKVDSLRQKPDQVAEAFVKSKGLG